MSPPHNYMKPLWPAPKNIIAYTTTRRCGNLALHVGGDAETVHRNRAAVIQDLQLPCKPIWLHQVHGSTVISLDSPVLISNPTADAAISREFNQICTVLTADCLPILVTNMQGTLVAAIHAGWRGLLAGVIENTITALNTPVNTLLVWLGPAISSRYFEVGSEVRALYLDRDNCYEAAFTPRHDKWLADLYQLARLSLTALGINTAHIYGGEFCTYQDNTRFYSYRRDKDQPGQAGRMASFIYRAG